MLPYMAYMDPMGMGKSHGFGLRFSHQSTSPVTDALAKPTPNAVPRSVVPLPRLHRHADVCADFSVPWRSVEIVEISWMW